MTTQQKAPKKGSSDENETKVRELEYGTMDKFNKSHGKTRELKSSPILRSGAAQVLRQIAINAGEQSLNGI